MKKEELVKGLTYLGLAFGKEYKENECVVYYDFLGHYPYKIFKSAIDTIIRNEDYLPRINKLIKTCEQEKINIKLNTVDYMKSIGYFSSYGEYAQTKSLIEEGREPESLRNDLNEFYKQMVTSDNNEIKLLVDQTEEQETKDLEKQIERIKRLLA